MRFSCIKKAENSDNYILRIYNPCKSEQSCSLVFNKRISKAWETNLNEERVKEITVNKDGDFTVKLAAKKICTIELEL
jgi:alpha-mannosidase